MKYFESKTTFDYSWDQVTQGFWQRYPNPYSSHVLSEDTVNRSVRDGCLFSVRLLTKTNLPPKWGEHIISARTVKIIEESIVNLKDRTLTTYTRNIGYTKLMSIAEKVVYREDPKNPNNQTIAERQAWIDSRVFGFSKPIQAFGLERFKKNSFKAEKGFKYMLENLFPNYKVSSSHFKHFDFLEQREKLKESAKRASEMAGRQKLGL